MIEKKKRTPRDVTTETIEERKKVLLTDIETVEEALKQLEGQKVQVQANLFALQGALQQCNYFLGDNVEEEETNDE